MRPSNPVRALGMMLPLIALVLLSVSWPEPAMAPLASRLLPRGDQDLIAYLDQADIPTESATRFLRAARIARTGDHAVAERAFLEVARATPSMSDWAYLLAADAAARRADTLGVRKHLASSSDWLVREWGWRIRVRALQANRQLGLAATLALGEAERLQLPAGRADARRTAAQLLLVNGDTARAVALLHDLVHSDLDVAVLRPVAVLLAKASTERTDLLQSARVLARAGDIRAASDLLPSLIRSPYLAGPARAQLRLDLARSHFDARRYADAQRISAELAADPAEPMEQRVEARVVLGRTLLRRGQEAPAIAQLERVLQGDVPGAIAQAAFQLADLERDSDRARALFERSAASAPESTSATESMVRLGLSTYARGRYDSALHWFERARTGAPRFQARATYWSGRARLQWGDTAASQVMRAVLSKDPVSYYAFRAAEQLGTYVAAVEAGPATSDTLALHMKRAFARYDLLRRAELFDLAAFEYERVRRTFLTSPVALYEFAEHMHASGQTQRAIALGRQLQGQRGVWDQRLLRIVYPLPYQDLIVAEAQRQSVDPFLAAALIRQESAFNPRATSVAGARGLMQIMPQTGRRVAKKAAVSSYANARLYEPALNVKLGMQHLTALLQAHSGRLVHVLSAYNAGAHRLDQWLSFPEALDDELFAERIPFAETRDYVRIVQQNAYIYRSLYQAKPPAQAASNPH